MTRNFQAFFELDIFVVYNALGPIMMQESNNWWNIYFFSLLKFVDEMVSSLYHLVWDGNVF